MLPLKPLAMPYIANPTGGIRTEIVCAWPGDTIDSCIAQALEEVAKPGRAFAYFDHNGVIVTVDKSSTLESAKADWQARSATKHNALTQMIGERIGIDWDKYDAIHGR
jgi:hypothetical protein